MGKIINIQRMSFHDGPGIRTTVFFAGCNLKCGWCHNPESQKANPQLQYFINSCTGCCCCVKNCPSKALSFDGGIIRLDKSLCNACFTCVDCCTANARRLSSREISPIELCSVLVRDKSYYDRSGGGVTFSGGEPFLQPDFLYECLVLLKNEGISTAVESALCVPSEIIVRLSPLIDYFMCDIKTMDEAAHLKHTGRSNRQILENIRLLSELDKKVLIRIPLVTGVNSTTENLIETANFLKNKTNFRDIELLRLHLLSSAKYLSLGIPDTLSAYCETTDKTYCAAKHILENEELNIL